MKKYFLSTIILGAISFSLVLTACRKELAPPVAKSYSWVEEFDTIQNSMNRGWAIVNNSRPLGTASWMQGEYGLGKKGITGFPAASVTYSGTDFALCTFNAGDTIATLSAWFIAPPTVMKNGDEISFFTRVEVNPATYADRMQVRLNAINNGVDVGNLRATNITAATAVGDFTQLLLDINPLLLKSGVGSYPGTWTKYTIKLSGLPAPVERRFAFRYFVTNGGPSGANSNGVAIDRVEFISK